MKIKTFPCGRSFIFLSDVLSYKNRVPEKVLFAKVFWEKEKQTQQKANRPKGRFVRKAVCFDAVALLNSRRDNENKNLPVWKVFYFFKRRAFL